MIDTKQLTTVITCAHIDGNYSDMTTGFYCHTKCIKKFRNKLLHPQNYHDVAEGVMNVHEGS